MPFIPIARQLVERNPRGFRDPIQLYKDSEATWAEALAAVESHRGPIFRVKDCVGVATPKHRVLSLLQAAQGQGASVWGKTADGRAYAFQGEDNHHWPTTIWIHLVALDQALRRNPAVDNFAELRRQTEAQRRPRARAIIAELEQVLKRPWVVWIRYADGLLEAHSAHDMASLVSAVCGMFTARRPARRALKQVLGIYYRRKRRLLPPVLEPYAQDF